MQTYIIRFNDPERGSSSAEIGAATFYDAVEDFQRRFPDCEVISAHVKPQQPWKDE